MRNVRVPIRFGFWKPLFAALGLTRSRSYVEVSEDSVRVRMGWSFDGTIPRASIRQAARRADTPWSIGVHGWKGNWIVNGAAGPLVELTVEPPAPARTLGIRLRIRTLAVSVDDPDGLIALLGLR